MNVIYVVLGSVGSFLGCVLALNQILKTMRRKWDQDAEQTKAVRENTKAVKDMTTQLATLSGQVADHERRLAAKGM